MRASRRTFLKATGVAGAAAATGAGVGTAAAQPDTGSLVDDLTLGQKAGQMTQVAISSFETFDALKRELDTLETAVQTRYEDGSPGDHSFEVSKSRPTIIKRLKRHIEAADCEVVLQVPADLLPDIRDTLRRARERGILVLLTLSGDDTQLGPRRDERDNVHTGGRRGGARRVLPGQLLAHRRGGAGLAAPSLPVRYDMFRTVVFTTALALRAGDSLVADLYARPTGSDADFKVITGLIVDVRQNLAEPHDSDFGFENSLVVDTGRERITVGGYGAFLEDYEVKHTTLRRA
ncbi:TrmB family transcriptional regulator sugar-binding domain-containing protein [Haloarcula marismortui]|uniref:TrmB family transcriptional regulator sugar-binding domain-containing protein n=1 Tax=Haloarcula marismortui TaxID=2238 RepID=UPI003C769338